MNNSNGLGLEYADTRTSYRAPRVAIIIDGSEDWIYWARHAIYSCCNIWGGHGFVLVPHINGVVNATILRAVRAYDPDYVVTLPITFRALEEVHPGTIQCEMDKLDTKGHAPEVIASLREQVAETRLNITQDEAARKSVVAVCSTYRMALGADSNIADWHERITDLSANADGQGPLMPLDTIPRIASPRFGARPEINSPIGLILCDLVGLVNEPKIDKEADSIFDEEVALFDSIIRSAGEAQVKTSWSCFEEINSAEGSVAKTAWTDSRIELGWVTDGRDRTTLYVVGNNSDDFCLALIWKRTYGRSVWIPDEFWREGRPSQAKRHRQTIAGSFTDLSQRHHGGKTILTTSSGNSNLLASFLDAIFDTDPLFLMFNKDGEIDESSRPKRDNAVIIEANDLDFPEQGRYFLGLQRQFQVSDTVPVIRDSEGGATLAATPASPVLNAPALGDTEVSFHIDLDIPSVTMPQGRATPPSALMRTSVNYLERYHAWVRNGRRGVSYESKRYDFVQAGILPQERLARPRIRMPGMLTWARYKAEMSKLELQVSDAGWPAHILAGMCGSRLTLTNIVAGSLRPALLKFNPQPKGTSTTSIFKDDDGFVVNGQVYLTLHGFELSSGLDTAATRAAVDELLNYGILKRGVLLRCSVCRIASFYSIDDIRQSNTCPRCGNRDQFTQERWQAPEGEPTWAYDLHPLARNLFRDHADVSLLLAAYLRKKAGNQYSDAPEVVAVQDRKTIAEADLIAVAAGVLVVGEAKSNGNLGRRPEEEKASIKKRLKLAEIFGADEIVIGTTQPTWKAHSLIAIKAAIDSHPWQAALRPKLRVVTALAENGSGEENYI